MTGWFEIPYTTPSPPFGEIVHRVGEWVIFGVFVFGLCGSCGVLCTIAAIDFRRKARDDGGVVRRRLLFLSVPTAWIVAFVIALRMWAAVVGFASMQLALFVSLFLASFTWWVFFPPAPALLVFASSSRGRRLRALLSGPRRHPRLFASGWLLLLGFLAGVAIVFDGLCVCERPLSITFRSSRWFQTSTCAEDAICHQYSLLASPDPSTSLVVKWHYAPGPAEASRAWLQHDPPLGELQLVGADGEPAGPALAAHGQWFHTGDAVTRIIYTARVDHLPAGSLVQYFVRVHAHAGTRVSQVVRTQLVDPEDEVLAFAAGGDLGILPETRALNSLVAQAQPRPRFAILGGDIAYANNMPSCYRRWDDWFALWDDLRSPGGLSLPIVPVVGNHEAGTSVGWNRVHFYAPYFSMPPAQGLPPVPASYALYRLPHSTWLLVLDSSHVVPADDPDQLAFLRSALANATADTRLVVAYHVPMYESCDGDAPSDELQVAWEPLFDEFCVELALEAHSHRYFRTLGPNRGLSRSRTCPPTVHVGGGAWGALANSCVFKDYISVGRVERHVLLVNVSADALSIRAVNPSFVPIDDFSISSLS